VKSKGKVIFKHYVPPKKIFCHKNVQTVWLHWWCCMCSVRGVTRLWSKCDECDVTVHGWKLLCKLPHIGRLLEYLFVHPLYKLLNKNPSAWNFLSRELEVMCGTVAIIFESFYFPHICTFVVFLCLSLQSIPPHKYEPRTTIHLLNLKLKHKTSLIFPGVSYATRDGWGDRTVPFLWSAGVTQAVERVLAVAFENKLSCFESQVSLLAYFFM
jgi:hypothetical protein